MFTLIARVKNLLLSPRTEWEKIDIEVAEPRWLVLRYVAPLALIPAVATFIGLAVLGVEVQGERYRAPMAAMAASVVLFVLLTTVSVYAFAWVIDVLAPRFGGKRDFRQAFKVSAYSITAAMVAGAVTVVPALGVFALLGATYSLYLLFLGVPKLMQPTPDSATSYAIVATGSAIVLALAVGLAAMFAASTSGGIFPKLAQMPDFGFPGLSGSASDKPALVDSGAAASITPAHRPADAVPITSGDLKDAAPLKLLTLDRVAVGALSSGLPAARTISLEAEYRRGKRYLVLQMTFSPTIADAIGFGGPATSEFDRETADGYSRRRREGDAIIVEDWNTASESGSFGRLLQDRFYVRAQGGGGLRPADLRRAVESFGQETLVRLERAG